MTDWMAPDIHEAEEYIDKKPAPAGEYTLLIKSNPKYKVSKSGTPYLEWFLVHTGENAKFTPIYERTMMAGKGAFRHFQIFGSLGFSTEDIKTKFKYRTLAPLTEANAKEGVPCELSFGGEKYTPAGKTLRATLKIETADDGTERSVISKLAKAA